MIGLARTRLALQKADEASAAKAAAAAAAISDDDEGGGGRVAADGAKRPWTRYVFDEHAELEEEQEER